MSQLTTHILDTTKGKPAQGVAVVLYRQRKELWEEVAKGSTDNDGRIPGLLQKDMILEPGTYKLWFDTQSYFARQSVRAFYPFVEISFSITTGDHYHVPLLLNPFGYSTYRGS